MSNFNFVDFIILAIFFFSVMGGLARGFVGEMVSLLTWIAAFIIATTFTNPLAQALTASPAVQNIVSQASTSTGVNTAQPVSYMALGLCFVGLFAATLMFGSMLSYFLNVAVQTGMLGAGNRLLGGMFGFVRGFILNVVFIFLVQLTPFGGESWWQGSQLVNSFRPAVDWVSGIVAPSLSNLKSKVGETLENVNTKFQGVTN